MWNFLLGVCVAAVPLCSAVDGSTQSRSGLIQQLAERLAELAEEGRGYLGKLAGEQTVLSVHKAFSQVLASVAASLATGLNVVLQYVSQCTQAAGLQLNFPPDAITATGLIFVVQWVLVALLGYILLSLTFQLLAATLHRALWLLKVGVALACFAHLLRDPNLSVEARAVQIGILLLVCMLLGVGVTRGPNVAEKTQRLEEQLRKLQERLENIEDWRMTEAKRRD